MNTPQPSDIRILDKLLALHLDISLWSARKKLHPKDFDDFGGVDLPPDELATLGSKRIAPPESLRIFGTLKARAFNYLDKHGVRFMSGWAIPENKATDIIDELISIRDEFYVAKEEFLVKYDSTIQDWIAKHATWGNIIASSIVSPDYVRHRMSFAWQMYKVAPLMQHTHENAVLHAGLTEEVENLSNTLFGEISRSANDMWQRVYSGKTEVTHKALSPLKTLYGKLQGLTCIEPHIAPISDIIRITLQKMPSRGGITGNNLLMLQGLVCLLRDTDALLGHANVVIQDASAENVLDALLCHNITPKINTTITKIQEEIPCSDIAILPPVTHIPSMGLW